MTKPSSSKPNKHKQHPNSINPTTTTPTTTPKPKNSFYTRKLLQRLKNEHDISLPPDTQPKRTYAGHWQRDQGAWSWYLYSKSEELKNSHFNLFPLGSQWTIKQCATATSLTVHNQDIIPDN